MRYSDIYETFYKDIYEKSCRMDYEIICEGLKLYKDDEVFRMEYPNVDEMIKALNEGKEIFEKNFYKESSNEYNNLYDFINDFEEKRDDIKWFYENKHNYNKQLTRYEHINFNLKNYENKRLYEQVDKMIFIYNMCQDTYKKAEKYLSKLCYLDLYDTKSDFNQNHVIIPTGRFSVKYYLTNLQNHINDYYNIYENIARENRNIIEEVNETISTLEKYSKDYIFIKEVPNVFHIIKNLKKAQKTKDEDIIYKAMYEVSYIRDSINLYRTNEEYMKFFHNNRNIKQRITIKKEMDKYPPYIQKLYYYIEIFDESKTLSEFLQKTNLQLNLNYPSLEKFTKWVIEGINEWNL